MYDSSVLTQKLLLELREIAENMMIPKSKITKSNKSEIIDLILKKQGMQEQEQEMKEDVVSTTAAADMPSETPKKEKKERTRIQRKVAEKVVPAKKTKEEPQPTEESTEESTETPLEKPEVNNLPIAAVLEKTETKAMPPQRPERQHQK
ncbi:MAG TPA: hypothetical protein PLK15_04525, partial [Chitinophagales bacterium]|nr:hypothetical protein [Chitinophagales bacterium]